jgi:hypothetical protein
MTDEQQFGYLTFDLEVTGEGRCYINGDFFHMHQVAQLDALGDWIATLQRMYEQIQNLKPTEEIK